MSLPRRATLPAADCRRPPEPSPGGERSLRVLMLGPGLGVQGGISALESLLLAALPARGVPG